MKHLFFAVTFCLLAGCFNAPIDLPLGAVGGGSPATGGGSAAMGGGTAMGGGEASGGGAAGGNVGGGAAGGAAGGQAGGAFDPDAGLVTPPAPLAETECGKQLPATTCPSGDAQCITWERPGMAAVTVASATDLIGFQRDVGRVGDEVFYLSDVANGASTLWSATPTGSPTAVKTTAADAGWRDVEAVAVSPTYGVWFVASGRDFQNPTYEVVLAPRSPNTVGASHPISASPTSNGVTWGGNYLIAVRDGLYNFYSGGGGQLVALPQGDYIFSIAVDAAQTAAYYVRIEANVGASLWRYTFATSANQRVTAIPPVLGVTFSRNPSMLAVEGSWLYLLTTRGVYRMPFDGSAPLELVYKGEAFPQYGGTLKSGSLKVIGNKLYFGQVCYVDFDAPGYGTIEADLATRTARWLDLDPAWPLVPYYVPYDPSTLEIGRYARPSGSFVVRP